MMGGFGMGWMWLFWLLLVAGLVLLGVVLVRVVGGGVDRGREPARPERSSRAREILDERYARGELTTQEYHERLRVLGNG
ncbi:MAG TPA: SHOCT domain-containing protein [Pseudonocardia sp.]|nr:SHOCT domain-containing protein [Pseudonocardia sp.]